MMSSKFLRVRCPRCNHLQVIFGKASTRVKCQECNAELVTTRGGKAKIKAQVKEIL
jgi:small subunit ribosomal protein S27e